MVQFCEKPASSGGQGADRARGKHALALIGQGPLGRNAGGVRVCGVADSAHG